MLELDVAGLSCSHCVSVVTRAVRSIDPRADVRVDLASKKVSVDSTMPREKIIAALADAGYTPG